MRTARLKPMNWVDLLMRPLLSSKVVRIPYAGQRSHSCRVLEAPPHTSISAGDTDTHAPQRIINHTVYLAQSRLLRRRLPPRTTLAGAARQEQNPHAARSRTRAFVRLALLRLQSLPGNKRHHRSRRRHRPRGTPIRLRRTRKRMGPIRRGWTRVVRLRWLTTDSGELGGQP